MIAYQMIYTGCGKQKHGDYEVWANSVSISKQECDEIQRLMYYIKPSNTPYDPTEEEIEQLCPKKYGYFVLSSGKKCLARSTYIGKVYNEPSRLGNYIIHAYVFDSLDEFNPFFVFNCDKFRKCLTYKEWHDDPSPDDLPAVELESPNGLPERDLKMLVKQYEAIMPHFLEAFLKCSTSESTLIFKDSIINQYKLYMLVGTMLPNVLLEKLTFSTQSFMRADVCPVKINNFMEIPYNCYDNDDSNAFLFDFEKNKFSTMTEISRYVLDILNDLKSQSYFNVLCKVDKINSIIKNANCDIETANAIFNLSQKNYEWFKEISDLNNTLCLTYVKDNLDISSIVSDIYYNLIKRYNKSVGQDLLPLIRTVFKLLDKNQKAELICWFYENIDDFLSNDVNAQVYLENFKKVMPFEWIDFVNFVLSKSDSYLAKLTHFNKCYILYRVYIFALENNKGEKQSICKNILLILKATFERKDINKLKLLLNDGKALGVSYERFVADNILSGIYFVANDENSLRFGFAVINIFSYDEVKRNVLEKYLAINLNSKLLIPVYIEYSKVNNVWYQKFETELSTKQEFMSFFIKKMIYIFNNESKVTFELLDSYFKKIYSKGYDDGSYYKKLSVYLNSLQQDVLLNEALKLYERLSILGDSFGDLLLIIELIEERIYSSILDDDLIKLNDFQFKALFEINEKLKRNNKRTSLKYEVIEVLRSLKGISEKSDLNVNFTQCKIYDKLCKQQLLYVTKYHMDKIFTDYLKMKRNIEMGKDVLIEQLFKNLFLSLDSDYSHISLFLDKLGKKEHMEILADMNLYSSSQQNDFAKILSDFINFHLNSLKSHGETRFVKKIEEKFISPVSSNNQGNKSQIESNDKSNTEYDKSVNKQRSRFFEKIFGKKNKK